MFLGSLIGSPGPAHTRPASPLPCPGRLAMIVTEYMENGSLDAFLRVRLCPPGEGCASFTATHPDGVCLLAVHIWRFSLAAEGL